MPSKHMMRILKGLQHLWLIWVRMNLKFSKTGEIRPEESFTNAYVKEVYESENACLYHH